MSMICDQLSFLKNCFRQDFWLTTEDLMLHKIYGGDPPLENVSACVAKSDIWCLICAGTLWHFWVSSLWSLSTQQFLLSARHGNFFPVTICETAIQKCYPQGSTTGCKYPILKFMAIIQWHSQCIPSEWSTNDWLTGCWQNSMGAQALGLQGI